MKPVISKYRNPLSPSETDPCVIEGLKHAILNTSFISKVSFIFKGEMTRPSSVMENIMKKVQKDIRTADFKQWNNIQTYLEIKNIGPFRAALIYKAYTGQEIPPIIIDAHYAITKFFTAGVRVPTKEERKFFESEYGYCVPYFTGSSLQTVDDFVDWVSDSKEITSKPDKIIEYLKDRLKRFEIGGEDYLCLHENVEAENAIQKYQEIKVSPLKPDVMIESDYYSSEQISAIEGILKSDSKIDLLCGQGGTGKTDVICEIIRNIPTGQKVVACAFTGKASDRMRNSLGEVEEHLFCPVSTLDSIIFSAMYKSDFEVDVLIIDEASTVSNELFYRTFQNLVEWGTKIILVGDPGQLPPVSAGCIFDNIVEDDIFPKFTLNHVFRTTDQDLLKFFLKVRNNQQKEPDNDFFVEYDSYDTFGFIRQKANELFNQDPEFFNKSVVLFLKNDHTRYFNYCVGCRSLEIDAYDWEDLTDNEKRGMGDWWWNGARIVFTKNELLEDGKVFNGMVGTVTNVIIDHSMSDRFNNIYECEITLPNGEIRRVHSNYENIMLGFGMNVYKAQGSEYENVHYIHTNSPYEDRKLVYTALTRTKKNLKVYIPKYGTFRIAKSTNRKSIIGEGSK